METCLEAFGRALSWWCQRGGGDLEGLLNRIVFEAQRNVGSDVKGFALLLKRRAAPFFVARHPEVPLLPVETLLSLFVAHQRDGGVGRVRDHALDPVRFIEGRFRTSIIASVEFPTSLAASPECAVWFGLPGAASAETIASAEGIASELSEWLESYGGVIAAQIQTVARRKDDERRIAELQALLHDARAPLGVLRYLTSEGVEPDSQETVARELEYLDKILGQGAPRKLAEPQGSRDIGAVLSRVAQRYEYEVGRERIRIDRGYEALATSVSDLDVERIVTNVVSNAYRHSPGSHVTIALESRQDRVVVMVRDTGRGIAKETLQAIEREETLTEESTTGWGIGLRSCRAKLRSCGGDLKISSEVGQGTVVELSLPRVVAPVSQPTAFVAEPVAPEEQSQGAEVAIIDDDQEHRASLERLLRRYGVRARQFATVESFVRELSQGEGGIVLCDANMPDGGAERLLSLMTDRSDEVRVAVMSGEVTDEYLYKVSALGAQAFFCKPVDLVEVCTWIREVQGMALRA